MTQEEPASLRTLRGHVQEGLAWVARDNETRARP